MNKYVTYYRVSTDKQGAYGLGMDAQRESVRRYINFHPGELVGEYSEVESARANHLHKRPQLQAALAHAKKTRSTLLVAKLDRLSRSVMVVSTLLAANVDFVAVDLPEANRLTIHLLAAMSEFESRCISERTKAALAVKKARGERVGASSETLQKACLAAVEARRLRRESATHAR